MAKSEHGLPARSGATKMFITREEYNLNCSLAAKEITFEMYEKKFQELKKKNLIRRR